MTWASSAGCWTKAAGSHLILASSCPSLIAALKLRGLRTSVRSVHIVLHGNLTVLWSWRSRNPLMRLTDLRTAMGLPSRLPVRYFVMEPAIRGELLATLPRLNPADVRLLPHPVSSVEASLEGCGDLGTPVRIGFMGAASARRASASSWTSRAGRRDRGWSSTRSGGWGPTWPGEDLGVLATRPLAAGKVGRAEYVERLAGMHYVCMPYGAGHYRYSPSGVLADALALARPILAFDLPIFRDLFDRFGDIGHLCRNAEEMAELIRQRVMETGTGTVVRWRPCGRRGLPGWPTG